MNQLDFKGELSWIDPQRLVKEKDKNILEGFFLVLGSIFNDLKGLILFEKLISETYRKPENDEVSVHAGEYGGLMIHIQKLIASMINEFFRFLKENENVLSMPEFQSLLKRLRVDIQENWNAIVGVATGRIESGENFTKVLLSVRNNIGFHYYQSGKELRSGFIKKFFKKEKSDLIKNEHAYYSLGEDMAHTRFFFSDASVEEYLLTVTSLNKPEDESDYRRQLLATIDSTNFCIMLLMKEYLRNRRNSPQ